jgi:RNA polymerase sigma-70 factor (ECF subfamily)
VISAARIASQTLGVPVEEAAGHQLDAVGEICYMPAIQSQDRTRSRMHASVPTINTGKSYELHSRADYVRLKMPLLYGYTKENRAGWPSTSQVAASPPSRQVVDSQPNATGMRYNFGLSSLAHTMIGPVITPFGKMAQNEERWRGYLKRCHSGDRQSLAQLYDETSSVIYGLALRMLNDPSAAAEVVLEVFQQVWTSPHTIEAAGSVLASLTSMTRRQALARFNKDQKGQKPAAPRSVPTTLPGVQSVLGHERDLVLRALALLDPAQREAIELAFFCGMTEVELARAVGVSPQIVKGRISSGMRKLNEALRLVSSAEGNA